MNNILFSHKPNNFSAYLDKKQGVIVFINSNLKSKKSCPNNWNWRKRHYKSTVNQPSKNMISIFWIGSIQQASIENNVQAMCGDKKCQSKFCNILDW